MTNDARVANRPAMLVELNRQLDHLDSESVAQLLNDNSIVAGVVRTYPQLTSSDEFQKGAFVIDVSSADGVVASSIRPPYVMSDQPLSNVLPAVGEHTAAILAGIGRSADDINALAAAGIVGVR